MPSSDAAARVSRVSDALLTIIMSLEAAARIAYRDLWRASRVTFSGDPPVLIAFREKMRIDAASWKAETDEAMLQQSLKGAHDVATFLRRNVAQIQKIPAKDEEGNDLYRVRLTEFHERGDNNANRFAKAEVPEPSSRRQRKPERQQCCQSQEALSDSSTSVPPRNYSQRKHAHRERVVPELKEEHLEEKFVRGGGPGGQSINKTRNNVQLLHKPTGIRVACQETRSLEQNRKIARRILLDKLDQLTNPGLSKSEMRKAKHLERERQRRKKAKKKKARLGAEKAGDADNDDD
ncbi:RF-1 domain-containing protein [Vararia minispora EC-137]|uniref:RF-1 domain-containing protein n=1 Tax=Vararia minispora EC-137 TaxID=1314806 RepID=A0ACB8QI26_9AGAM|nr:RF-1 domain-containing protein [Vararia minispora EC-137]